MQDLMDMNTEINEAMSRSYALPEFDESELNSGFAFSFPCSSFYSELEALEEMDMGELEPPSYLAALPSPGTALPDVGSAASKTPAYAPMPM